MTKVKGINFERTREAKKALLRAALEIIAESGLGGLTLANVGDRAGYSRGLARYHYGSKEALISALIEWVISRGQKILKVNTHNGLASILDIIDNYNEGTRKDPLSLRGYFVLSSEMTYSSNPTFRQKIRDYQSAVRANFIEAFIYEGVSQDQAEAAALLVLAGLRGLIQQWIAQESLDIDKGFEALKTALIALITVRD